MKRSAPIARSVGLGRSLPLDRVTAPSRSTAPKRSQPERDWSDARAKVAREGKCRVCGEPPGPGVVIQAAHVIGREHDRPNLVGRIDVRFVRPIDTVPLCVKVDGGCHGAYDGRRLDLLPHLTHAEQAAAVELVGLVAAYRRITGTRGAPDER